MPTANLNGSRVMETYVRTHPDVVRAFVMDSPALATPDVLTIGPAALDLAIERLSAACTDQPACHSRTPDLSKAIREATEKLDAAPITIDVDGTLEAIRLGHPIRVVIDGAAYLRYVRHTLGGRRWRALRRCRPHHREGPRWNDRAGRYDRDDAPSDPGDCLGLLPRCDRA